jgi:hypothetical protein
VAAAPITPAAASERTSARGEVKRFFICDPFEVMEINERNVVPPA